MIYREEEIIVYESCIRCLQQISLFPENGGSFDGKLFLKFVCPKVIFGFPIFMGLVGHIYQSFYRNNITDFVYGLYVANFFVMYYTSAVLEFYYGNRFLSYLSGLSRAITECPDKYECVMKFIEYSTKVIYYGVVVNILLSAIGSYKENMFCNDIEFNDNHYVCGILVPLWYPVEIDKKLKPLFAIYTTLFALTQIPSLSSAITLYLSIFLLSVRIDQMINLLKVLQLEMRNKDDASYQLKYIVRYYIETTRLVRQMNEFVGVIFLPSHNVYNMVMIGTAGYLVVKVGDIGNIFQLILWLFLMWLSCYSGQCLEDANSLLQEELYNICWYHMDPSLRSSFKIFQGQISLHLHLEIQPFHKLNLAHFAEVVNGAYTFVMFLQKMSG